MLKLELAAPQKTRPPPAPAFSAPFSSPTLKWPRRKRQDWPGALPHSRRKRQGRLGSPPAGPASNAEASPNHPHSPPPSPSPSRAPERKRAPIRHKPPSNEEEEDVNDGGDMAQPQDNGGAMGRKGLGKPIILALAAAVKGGPNGAASAAEHQLGGRSLRPRGAAGATQRRAELWVSLSREEIEEDYYSITGGRLPRRPKRRPRAVQPSVVDRIFPGSWLPNTVFPEMYKVHDPAEARRVRA